MQYWSPTLTAISVLSVEKLVPVIVITEPPSTDPPKGLNPVTVLEVLKEIREVESLP